MPCLVRRGDVAIGLVSECESVCCVVVGETETRDGMITPDIHHFSCLMQTDGRSLAQAHDCATHTAGSGRRGGGGSHGRMMDAYTLLQYWAAG